MSEAPERIWADGNAKWTKGSWGRYKEFDNDVEYVRADRIEELKAKLATCEKYKAAYAECDRIGTKAVRELEAKLTTAVKALERIEDASRYFGSNPEASETTVRYAHETTRRLCSTTLAELKGEDRG